MKMLRCVPTCIPVLFVFALVAPAQIPGQYPPGQYPPGQYPPGTRSPIPRIPGQTGPVGGPRGRQPQPESRGKRSNSEAQLLTTTSGILRRVGPNQLVIEPDDHRVVWYRLAPQMMVQKDGKDADLKDFALGDYLARRFQLGRRQHQHRGLGDLEEGRDARGSRGSLEGLGSAAA